MKKPFKLFGIITITVVIVFSMAACVSAGGGRTSAPTVAAVSVSDGVTKTLVINGIDVGLSGDVLVDISADAKNLTGSMVAVGGSTVSGGTLQVPLVLPGKESDRWTGTGEYFVVLVFNQAGKNVIYFFSSGGMSALKYNFTEATTNIPFSQFRKL